MVSVRVKLILYFNLFFSNIQGISIYYHLTYGGGDYSELKFWPPLWLHWKPLAFQIPSLTSWIGAFWEFSKNLYKALTHCVTILSDYLIHLVGWETRSCIQHLHLIPSALGMGNFKANGWDPDVIPLMFNFYRSAISPGLTPFSEQCNCTNFSTIPSAV